MKMINKSIALAIVLILAVIGACKEPFDLTPVPATSASTYKAFFIFGNASDATSLDFFVNNIKTSETTEVGEGQTAYTTASIPSNGITGAASANTNLRAKATTGAIGGVLGSNDAIFRGSNTGTGNFTAVDSAYYTVIALDTITRPAPIRKLNAGFFGDVTFFNPFTGEQLGVLDTVGLANSLKAQLITIGIVPLGSTDVGGPRFVVYTDQLPLPSTTRLPKPAAGKASVRFVNGVGDAGTVTFTLNTVATGGSLVYPFLSSQLNPSVGSRTATPPAFVTVNAGSTDVVAKYLGGDIASTAIDLADGGVYTIFVTGSRKAGTAKIGFIKNK